MKYRLFALLLAVCLLCGCAAESASAPEQSFSFYYPSNTPENGALCQAAAELDPAAATPEQVLGAYLSSVPPEGAKAPLPSSWFLRSAKLEDSTAVLRFSGVAAKPLDTALACACLGNTLLQLDSVEQISLSIPGQKDTFILTESSVLLEDTGMLPQNESIVLYFPDSQCRYLTRRSQTVEAMDAASKPRYVVEQLLSNYNINSCIPAGTRLLNIFVENGLCTVDLSSEFVQNMAPDFSTERLAVYSIVNTLTELPQIQSVDIWVAGAPLSRLTFMDFSASLSVKESLLAPKSKNIQDATLYVSCDGEQLVGLPTQLTPREDEDTLTLLMEALIAFDGEDGAQRCIPAGTKLLSLRLEEEDCIVDLTGEFLNGCTAEEEQLAVRSVVATLCGAKHVSSVEILVEGLEPVYQAKNLRFMTSPKEQWFAEH